MSLFSVGGLVSGLDTNAIIAQLMQVDRIPVAQLQGRQRSLRAVSDAWTTVTTRASAVRTAVDALTKLSKFDGFVAVSSSNTDAVAATKSGTPTPGSLSFTVDQLATVHQVAGNGTFGADTDLVGAGTFTVTIGGAAHAVTTDDTTTLAGLAAKITGLGVGVSGQAVKVADGSYRLFVASDATGSSQAFTVSTDLASLGTFSVVQQAQDAKLTIGSGTGAITVTRASNTISDLIGGVTLTIKQTTTSAVTVSTSRDVDAAAAAITQLVDDVNAALTTLKDLTKYDAESGKAGRLQGDSTARQLVLDLRSAISNAVSGLSGAYTSAGSVGISLTREGTFTVDQAALKGALAADFDAVARLFARTGATTDSRVAYVTSSDKTVPGTYDVTITQAAKVASITGATYQAPPTDPETFTITADDGTVVSVTVGVNDGLATAVSKVNNALAAAGVTAIKASETTLADGSGAIRLDETRHGSAIGFTVDGAGTAFGLKGTHAGTDVAGTINGQAATGAGQSLTSTTGDSTSLAVRVTASQANVDDAGGSLALGTVTVSGGVAGNVSRVLSRAEGSAGSIARAKNLLTERVELYQEQIDAYEVRLASRELTYRRRFAAMESALSRLTSQGNWLAAQLGTFSQPRS